MRRSLSDFQVGEPFGRYELLFPVAEGGMSRVWAARLRGTRGFQKVVALKTLLANGPEGQALEHMLLDEARHAAAIQHPNVAQYLDVGEQEGVLFLVMEWLDGESLSTLIKNARRTCGIPLGVAVEIVVQACKGLHAAHELRDGSGHPLGLVHCDVSPQNIMLTGAGAAKLIDFGVARATLGAASGTNAVTGKLSFMAPEQIRGREFDRRADLFSLGIVLYLLSTGQHPFPGKSPREIMQRIRVGEKPRPPSQLLPGFPRALERVVLSALEHSPENRFATASEMANELLRATPERADEPALAAFVEKVCSAELDVKRRAIARALSLAPSASDSQKLAVSTPPPSSRRLPSTEAASSVSSTLPATVVTAPIPAPLDSAPPRRGKLLGASLFIAAALAGFLASNFDRFRPLSGEAGVPHPSLESRPASASAPAAPPEPAAAPEPAANPDPAAETASEPEPEPERRVDKPAKRGSASARHKPARPGRPAAASPARPAPAQKPARALKDTERDAVQRYGI